MMGKRAKTLEEQLYLIGLVFLVAGGAAVFIYLKIYLPNASPIPCVLHRFTGLYCPGCGGTRAVIALLEGHLLQSLWYHPLVLYTVVIYGGFMLTQTLERIPFCRCKGWRFREWHLYGALVIIVINCILKNILLLGFHITL